MYFGVYLSVCVSVSLSSLCMHIYVTTITERSRIRKRARKYMGRLARRKWEIWGLYYNLQNINIYIFKKLD